MARRPRGAATPREHKGGRPTKFTPERIEKFLRLVRVGNYQTVAARAVGWSEPSFFEYKKKHPEFSEAVDEAEAEAEAHHVAQLAAAGKKSWQASLAFLERKHHDRWGRREKLEHGGQGDGPIKVELWQPPKKAGGQEAA